MSIADGAVTTAVDLVGRLEQLIGADRVLAGPAIPERYWGDESLATARRAPDVVVAPASVAEVAAVVRLAYESQVPLVPRGAGTGLSGGAVPLPGALLLSTERLDGVAVDSANSTATVGAGVALSALDEAIRPHGLVYPIDPGERSSTIGGNVATNAGGMRAIRYGVTRHQLLGLTVVLADGTILRTGGKLFKSASGYDLTQLFAGSEGTLGVICEAEMRLYPRLGHRAGLVVPFASLEAIGRAIPELLATGITPLTLEYLDRLALWAVLKSTGLRLGIPPEVADQAQAFLVVAFEHRDRRHLDDDIAVAAEALTSCGALEAYAPELAAVDALLDAREKAFWVAKDHGVHDIVDTVVPRSALASFMTEVRRIADETGSIVTGCGHAGDGNVHLSLFQPDSGRRETLLRALLAAALAHGGAISAEHGIGKGKRPFFEEMEDPVKLAVLRSIKAALDPRGILAPGTMMAATAASAG